MHLRVIFNFNLKEKFNCIIIYLSDSRVNLISWSTISTYVLRKYELGKFFFRPERNLDI